MSEDDSTDESNSDETFAFLNILDMLSETNEFRQWLSDFHKLKEHERYFEGYKFAVITALISFMNSFTMHDPFRLKDDEICYRAEFRGIKLEHLPNSCEKIIFQKNVWGLGKQIRRSTDWKNLNVKNELLPLLEIFDKIKKGHLKTTKNIGKTNALTYLSEFYTYLFLIDVSLGRPKGYNHPFFSVEQTPEYLDKTFEGYAYSLQFLWYKMLGKDVFANSCVKNLHRCQEVQFPDEGVHISTDLGESFETYEPELSPEEKKKQEFATQVQNKWDSIDQFFAVLRSEIIRPLEDEIGHSFGSLGEGLVRLVNFEKNMLGILLDKTNLTEPAYMTKNDLKSMKKRLDVEFLWYDIDMLDARRANREFNGVFAFNALLTGYVRILKEQKSEGKIKVLKIVHPPPREGPNYYSVAILVGSHGFFSDSSGWIVFYDSLIGSSGTGGYYRDLCFDCINKFKKQARVELKEITVDKKIFQQYLESRKISFSNGSELSTVYKDVEDYVALAKGKLFEYIFLKYCVDNEKYSLVKGDFSLLDQQIDCMCIEDDTIYVFECKLQIHDDIQEYVKQIKNISNVIKKQYPGKKVISKLVVYHPVLEERTLKFKKKRIDVIHSFKNAIQTDRTFSGERRKLLHALDFELQGKFYRRYDEDWFS